MNVLEVVLPGSILVLAFVTKLFVDRTATVPDCITAVLELPVDIAFLATTLIAAFAISKQSHDLGVVSFVLYIIGSIVVVVLWRRSTSFFIADRYWWSCGFAVFGYVICGYGLVHAIALVSGATR